MGGAVSLQSESGESRELKPADDGKYYISTAEQLKEFADKVNDDSGKYTDIDAELTADIDLNPGFTFKEDGSYSGPDGEEPHQWTPIGNIIDEEDPDSFGYTGTFDGNGKTISGLYIKNTSSDTDYQGFFGYVGSSGKIENLSVSGTVTGNNFVGGVVGRNRGTVENCYNTGTVTGNNFVGGIVGNNNPGASVENCYNTGSVSGPDSVSGNSVGGVVGYNGNGIVTNSYNTGEVSGNNHVGGVVGLNSGGSVENCYNIGEVSGPDSVSGSYVGGVVGYNSGPDSGSSGTVTDCYFLKTDDVNKDLQGIGNDSAEDAAAVKDLSDQDQFKGWDFIDTWRISKSLNRPVLQDNAQDGLPPGLGTKEHPYEIKTAAQLKTFRDLVNGANGNPAAWAVLMENITLNSSEEWTPIGNSESTAYTGTFDGDGHTISGLYINDSTANNQGLFGYVSGTVQNLTVSGSVNSSGDYVGGIVGNNSGTFENCAFTGSVSGDWYVGGVVGNNNGGTVTGCIFSGSGSVSVTGSYSVGGVVGKNSGSNGSVEKCHNTGSVSGSREDVGGVVGDNEGTVENCYNTGAVSGLDSGTGNRVGGVVGDNGGNVENCYNTGTVNVIGNSSAVGGVVGRNDSSVQNCYNTGTVTGSGGRVGGVVGWNSGNVTNCYNTDSITVTGSGGRVGGVVGYNSGSVENCYNTGTVSGSGGHVDGVVGDNRGTVKNCYYQIDKSAIVGIGGTTADDTTTVAKTAEQFSSGEVAYLLQSNQTAGSSQVWGQNIDKDKSPVLTSDPGKTVYKVPVNLNYTGAQADQVIYTNSTLNAKEPIREGYTFDGWYDNKACTGEAVTTITDTTATLYAKWTPNTYQVTLHTNDGTIAEGEKLTSYTYGVGAKLPTEIEITKTGYTFAGWYEKEDLTGDPVIEISATDTGEKEYWAKWTPNTYQVTLHTNGGTIAEGQNISSYTYGIGATLPTSVTREGYTFAGWYEKEDFTGDPVAAIGKDAMGDKTYWAKWEEVENPEPEPTPTPTPDPEPSGPSTGDSTGWDDILDELENTAKGDEITIDMGDETKVPAEIFESLAGKDVDVTFDLGDVQLSVNGADIPTDTDFTDLDLGASLDTHGIPVNVINTITGEVGTVQITLAHDGEFGFTMTLTAPLGKENAGYWANLYHYDESAEALNFEADAKIDEDGSVTIPFSHASQYAIVIDTHSHATVDVSDLFIDIAPDAWYKDAIQYAYDQGLMTGTSATEFAPEQTTTRAMIVSILARLEGVESAQAAGFADVDDNDWYATAVNWAASVGVVNGYEDNTFKPNTAITREQLAAILMNYAAYKGEDVSNRASLATYTDQPSTWAEEAISWAVAEGLISGVTNDQLQPQSSATRAQVAAILQRLLEA